MAPTTRPITNIQRIECELKSIGERGLSESLHRGKACFRNNE
jgi:hypothetical protein